ncbi:sensor kinase HydH [Legionella birminghamensis]|uniref:histidine kinase n=1 Tax=Legionella birminghamensis TaxID=28083 RepID=A0A378IC55_9GAMM|nr:ATP-binding protein [Legionella birminghamensis]KTC73078.1 sensor kinase HydH [Legionella birminghamensis]STX32345.1 sensor kinase HydH [Legionella birminghamensis]
MLSDISIKEILLCVPTGLIVLNTQGLIAWMNEAAIALIDADVTGQQWREVIDKVFSPKEDDGLEVSLVNGRRVHLAISSLSNPPGELIILTDFTATREYEHARENQNQLMTLGRMTAQLAHQIRTPLASAMLYAEHLSAMQGLEDRNRLWLSRLQACHNAIEQQIEELLLFARGERLEKRQLDLQQWSRALEERIYILFEDKTVQWKINNQLPVRQCLLHEEALIGAMLNLISNSLQAEAGQIVVDMIVNEEGSGFILRVSDNGKGMPPEVEAQVFSPFFTTRAQGTGLGLAIVKAATAAHKGMVTVNTSPGKGCIFELQIPW